VRAGIKNNFTTELSLKSLERHGLKCFVKDGNYLIKILNFYVFTSVHCKTNCRTGMLGSKDKAMMHRRIKHAACS